MTKRFRKFLKEKLILPNKGKRYGQVVILAGGTSSGKTYAKKHFIRSEDYTVIDDNPNRKELPNLMLDRTLAWDSESTNITRKLIKSGYKPENIHVIWILTDFNFAMMINKKTKRTFPDDVIMFTHKGAKTSMVNLIFGRTSTLVNGEVYVIYGGPENTVYFVDEKGKPLDGKDGGSVVIRDFDYIRVKESGKKPDRTGNIIRKLMTKVSQLTP